MITQQCDIRIFGAHCILYIFQTNINMLYSGDCITYYIIKDCKQLNVIQLWLYIYDIIKYCKQLNKIKIWSLLLLFCIFYPSPYIYWFTYMSPYNNSDFFVWFCNFKIFSCFLIILLFLYFSKKFLTYKHIIRGYIEKSFS